MDRGRNHPENIALRQQQYSYGEDISSWWYVMGRRYYYANMKVSQAVVSDPKYKEIFESGYNDAKGEDKL